MSNDKKTGIKAVVDKLKNEKKAKLFSVIIVLVVFGFFIAFYTLKGKDEKDVSSGDYVSTLETRLENVLAKISGAGKVSVMITVESGMETVLAKKVNVTESNGKIVTEETPIIVNGKTVTLKENYPKIVGVLIIAEGAGNISVLRKIQDATLSVLDVELKQVEILSMN